MLLAPNVGPAQERAASERWVGGLVAEDDYSALVLRLWRTGPRPRAELTYPNQWRTVDFDEVGRTGTRLTLRSRLRGETWSGTINGDEIQGEVTDPEGTTRFELYRAPEATATSLDRLVGTYQWPDGRRIGIEQLSRSTDRLLIYFDGRSGEEQWLFPETDSTFIAGPDFERPHPVRHRVRFREGTLAWSTGEGSWQEAVRLTALPDSVVLDSVVREFMERREVPSVVVGLVSRDGLLWGRAYGFADLAGRRPATLDTPYQVGSVTKVMTATLLTRLRDAGLFQLDDPLSRYLPLNAQPGTAAGQVTLRMLLTHTSGLPGNPVNRVDVDGVMQPYSRADLLAGLRHTRLEAPPGTRWSYSNLGYAILGHVMAQKTGLGFERLLVTRLFQPLGMTDSRITLPASVESRLAVHYWPEDSVRQPRPRWVFGDVAGFGGVTSTVPDLARFLALHLQAGWRESPPFSPGSLLEMQRPHHVRAGWTQAMGLGWWIRRDPQLGTHLFHGGEVDGHSSHIAFKWDLGLGVIVLANLGGSTAADLGEALLRETIEAARRRTMPTREWAFARFLDGDWGPAEWALGVVAESRPADGVAWLRLGIARFQLDRHAAAVIAFQRAGELDFFPEQALLYLARIRAIQGDREGAIGLLGRAAEKGFRNWSAVRGYPEFAGLLRDPRVDSLMR